MKEKTLLELLADDAMNEYDRSVRVSNSVICKSGKPHPQATRAVQDHARAALDACLQAACSPAVPAEARVLYNEHARSIAACESQPKPEGDFAWIPK